MSGERHKPEVNQVAVMGVELGLRIDMEAILMEKMGK